MIDTNSFIITREVDGNTYHVKTASHREGSRTRTVVWTQCPHKAKRFNGTPNLMKFVSSYGIKNVIVFVIKYGLVADSFPLEQS